LVTVRSIDRARKEGIRDTDGIVQQWSNLGEAVTKATVIVADNIEAFARDQGDHPMESYPCLAPPWSRAWIEYPNITGNQRRVVLMEDDTEFWRAATVADDVALTHVQQQWLEVMQGQWRQALNDVEANWPGATVRWMLALSVYIEGRNGPIVGPMGRMTIALDDRGKMLGNSWMLSGRFADGYNADLARSLPDVVASISPGAWKEYCRQDCLQWMLAALDAALWTISLSHMRNVVIQDVRPEVHRRHRKRGNLPPARYKVLKLALPRRGGPRGAGPRLVDFGSPGLHRVSGHFAHYGDCCPPRDTCSEEHGYNPCLSCGAHIPHGRAFGRITGMFWIPDMMRGDPDQGVVVSELEPKLG
jgi:hypothetical protein